MRRLFLPVLAFAAPFIVFGIYRLLKQQDGARAWPLGILFIAGAVLAVQAFALAALTEPSIAARPPDPPPAAVGSEIPSPRKAAP
ncbi:MAG: hypothetical protein NW200_14310 [Hyphomonadaceae bacterium]|nr:hypothetical protein [Hyphomonadaceae bacterium]